MRSILVFGSITRVGEGFGASRVFTGVRFLARMTSQMGLKVFQPGIGFTATLKLKKESSC